MSDRAQRVAPPRSRFSPYRAALHGALATLLAAWLPLSAQELTGFLGAEARLFFRPPALPDQADNDASLVAQPEFYLAWEDGRQSATFVPFLRLDSADPQRTHVDVRELIWRRAADTWELGLGVGKVFWGVTEAVHLVDIVNQTDFVEAIDGEEKLGQPMAQLSLFRDWGTLEFFVMPFFRERTFPGPRGRLRGTPAVDTDQAYYESSAGQWHTDFAVRWSHVIGDFDVGLSHFYGTSRSPVLVPGRGAAGQPALVPFYELVHQTGLDLQATLDQWLLKLEVVRGRGGTFGSYFALATGFEYTFVGVGATSLDLGAIAEYLYDGRGARSPNPFENDGFVGARLAFNDAQSSEMLAGIIQDLDGDATIVSVEFARRLGDRWRLEVDGRGWIGVSGSDRLFSLRNDSHVQVSVKRFF